MNERIQAIQDLVGIAKANKGVANIFKQQIADHVLGLPSYDW